MPRELEKRDFSVCNQSVNPWPSPWERVDLIPRNLHTCVELHPWLFKEGKYCSCFGTKYLCGKKAYTIKMKSSWITGETQNRYQGRPALSEFFLEKFLFSSSLSSVAPINQTLFDAGSACYLKKILVATGWEQRQRQTRIFKKLFWPNLADEKGQLSVGDLRVAVVDYFQSISCHYIPFKLPLKIYWNRTHQFSQSFAPSV